MAKLIQLSAKIVFLLAVANLMGACSSSGFGDLSQNSFCGSAGCTSSAASATGQDIYFALNNNTMVKQYSVASGVVPAQQLQISGTCNPNGAATNMITYEVANGSSLALIAADLFGVSYLTNPYPNGAINYVSSPYTCLNSSVSGNCVRSTTCDNGHFSLIITPPNDGTNSLTGCNSCIASSTGTNTVSQYIKTYQLTVQLWTGTSKLTLAAGPVFSQMFYVQY